MSSLFAAKYWIGGQPSKSIGMEWGFGRAKGTMFFNNGCVTGMYCAFQESDPNVNMDKFMHAVPDPSVSNQAWVAEADCAAAPPASGQNA